LLGLLKTTRGDGRLLLGSSVYREMAIPPATALLAAIPMH
jgi:hypothetical protein